VQVGWYAYTLYYGMFLASIMREREGEIVCSCEKICCDDNKNYLGYKRRVLEKYMNNFNVLLGITYIIYVHPNLNKVFKVSIDVHCPNQLYLLPIAKNHII
jgi:hypothetical protein